MAWTNRRRFGWDAGDTVRRNSGHTAELLRLVMTTLLDLAAAAAAAADGGERAHYPGRTRVRLHR